MSLVGGMKWRMRGGNRNGRRLAAAAAQRKNQEFLRELQLARDAADRASWYTSCRHVHSISIDGKPATIGSWEVIPQWRQCTTCGFEWPIRQFGYGDS